ncbi:2-hydroxyacid dehydrogenase [Demequina aurantiaca]|uniref:2-hydroxyacid dehydrogenase n=1 Tax=Demequina aurantiaca TaxID=676200 RepID=UPI0007867A7D|nr:2-hydroxyacid dehydrogenase [Demequina aurantiaca]
MMITVSVPYPAIADALGDVGPDARVVVWDPSVDDVEPAERDAINVVCVPHFKGGRTLYSRIAQCSKVSLIQIASAGYEHAAPFVPAGVSLANARGVHDTRTAEFAITLALASQRRMVEIVNAQQRGEWLPFKVDPSLADRKALVVGYGSIGAAIGSRLRAMEVDVEGVATRARTAEDGTTVHAIADVISVLPTAELVFLVTPHNDATHHLVNAEFLAAMPDNALLVNVGRGACVDTDALVVALETGRIRAALDVTDPEPLPEGHPLWSAPNVIVAPHVAGNTELTNRRYTDMVRAQINALRAGTEPINLVMTGSTTY